MPRKIRGTLSGDDQHILVGDNLMATPAEAFSEKPLYPVADNRIPHF
jgi:hypothetical protein